MSRIDFTARAIALRAADGATEASEAAARSAEAAAKAAEAAEKAVVAATAVSLQTPPPAPVPSRASAELQTFVAMQATAPVTTADLLESVGHAAPGWGAGRYVCDELATGALASAHPLACLAAADSRIFRLLGDDEGYLAPEQLGCPPSAIGTDQRAAIQATLDYARAVGLNGVKFAQQRYELWSPPRTAPFADETSPNGCFLVIDDWPCTLLGTNPQRTILHFVGPRGQSLASDYRVIAATEHGGDVIWRGHGILLTGSTPLTAPRPDAKSLAQLAIRDIALTTDAIATRNTSSPALPLSRDSTGKRENCRDPSNRAIWQRPGIHHGDVRLENCLISGFLGDAIRTAPGYQAGLTLRSVRVRHANGAAICLDGPRAVSFNDVAVENCGISWDGYGGLEDCQMRAIRFSGCGNGGIDSAAANPDGMRSDGSAPLMTIDASFENCAEQGIGSHTVGRITASDTQVALLQRHAGQWIRGVDLDLTTICHKANVPVAVRYAGLAGGTARITATQVRLNMVRTRQAIDAGFNFLDMVEQSGPLGPRNSLRARGQPARVGTVAAVTENYVAIVDDGLDLATSATAPTLFDPSATPSPDMGTAFLRTGSFASGNGIYTVSLPSTAMYADGAEISIEHREAAKPACFVEIAEAGLKRALLGFRDKVVVRCNKTAARWDIVRAPPPRMASASIGGLSTAMGAESGPYVIALPGARPWHSADVTPSAGLAGFAITNVRPDTDGVRFYLRNISSGATASLPAQTFTARCQLR